MARRMAAGWPPNGGQMAAGWPPDGGRMAAGWPPGGRQMAKASRFQCGLGKFAFFASDFVACEANRSIFAKKRKQHWNIDARTHRDPLFSKTVTF